MYVHRKRFISIFRVLWLAISLLIHCKITKPSTSPVTTISSFGLLIKHNLSTYYYRHNFEQLIFVEYHRLSIVFYGVYLYFSALRTAQT